MKVENLSAKRFFIHCESEVFDLLPASGVVDLPKGADKAYLSALEKQAKIRIHDALEIEDAVIVKDEPEAPSELELLRDEYELLADKKADGRWSESKLKEKIAELTDSE